VYVIRQFDATASERRSEVRLFTVITKLKLKAKGFHLILCSKDLERAGEVRVRALGFCLSAVCAIAPIVGLDEW